MARALARIVVLSSAAACVACAAVTGLGDYAIQPDEAPESPRPVEAGTTADSVAPPRDAAPDAPPDAPPADAPVGCSVAAPSGPIHAVHVTSPLTVDGMAAEWPCGSRIVVDGTTAQGKLVPPTTTRAELAVAWTEDRLFFLVRVTGASSLATGSADRIYLNDAVELYLGIDNPHSGPYRATDIQIIVDYLNRAKLFRDGAEISAGIASAHAVSAAVATGNDYVVEVSVAAAEPRPTYEAGQTFGFDLQIDEHGPPDGGINQSAYWLFQTPNPTTPHGTCVGDRDVPSCDQAVWGSLVLDP